jgi:hypothetical protein
MVDEISLYDLLHLIMSLLNFFNLCFQHLSQDMFLKYVVKVELIDIYHTYIINKVYTM